ncbi:MAG TPA: DUF1269 domain-containing protein [Solirubrobacteraceae bacterium]|jgi:uncharacterized membrane protein|nr:DUF1269 domain-containing protein [Solirubrobacteraceae bacterium]
MTTDNVSLDPHAPSGLDLAAVRFPAVDAAYEAFTAARASAGGAPWIQHVGFVERHNDGHMVLRGTFAGHYVDVDEALHLSEPGGGEGATVGGLIGVLGGPPGIAVGLVLGGLIGSLVGKPTETDAEPHALVEQLRAAVPRPSSAIVMIGPARDVDEMLAAIADSGGEVIRQTLTVEQAAALEASLVDAPEGSSGPSRRGEQAVEASEPGTSS